MTGYNSILKKFKYWVGMPDLFKTETRNRLVLLLHSLRKGFFHNIKSFQRRIVEHWNPSVLIPSKAIIPSISHRDEVTTDGFGMAVIELLCYAGIIEKVETIVNEKIVPEWILGYNWDKKFIYLCLDGLSLDRH